MVYDKLILGSGGDAEQPTDEDARDVLQEVLALVRDRGPRLAAHDADPGRLDDQRHRPAAGGLRKIYFDNARRLFARSLPLPVMKADAIERDFVPDGKLDEPEWAAAPPVRLEYQSSDASARPTSARRCALLWSERFLYLGYECPFTELTTFQPAQAEERIGMWEKDVVEAFIGSDPANPGRYTEYEWAPNGDWLDLKLEPPPAISRGAAGWNRRRRSMRRPRFGGSKSGFRCGTVARRLRTRAPAGGSISSATTSIRGPGWRCRRH